MNFGAFILSISLVKAVHSFSIVIVKKKQQNPKPIRNEKKMYLIITRSTDIVVLRFVRGRRNRKENNKLPPRGSWVTHTRTERIPRESFYPVYDDHNNNRNNSNVMFSLKRGPETLHGRVRGRRARRYH